MGALGCVTTKSCKGTKSVGAFSGTDTKNFDCDCFHPARPERKNTRSARACVVTD